MSRTWAVLALLSALTGSSAGVGASSDEAAGILRKADAPRDAFSEGVIHLRIVGNARGKKPVLNVIELFVAGNDRSLVVFREGAQQGRKILTSGDRVYLIVPGASRPIPVSKTQRLMGAASDSTIARLKFSDEYDAVLRPGEEASCRVLDLAARRPGSAYPSAVLWVGKDDGLPRRLLLSLASGKDAKEVVFTSYDGDHRIATMDIRDLLAAGGANVTTVAFERYEKRPLDPAMFELEGAKTLP
jgi:hypothetical protein